MGSISYCQSKLDIKGIKKEINSKKNIISKNKTPNNEKYILKENRIKNRKHSNELKNKFYKKILRNNNQIKDIKDFSKSKIVESSLLYQKYSPIKIKTNSCNSLTTNNNSKNIINNKRINTSDNTNNITTISDEETINNQNSIDFSNNLDFKYYKYSKEIKKRYLDINKRKKNNNKQIFNIINEENEDLINLNNIYDVKNKNHRNKKLFIFSCDSDTILSLNKQLSFNKNNNNNKKGNLSPQLTIYKLNSNHSDKIYKKSSCFNLKTNLISSGGGPQKKPIYKKVRKDKKTAQLDLNESNFEEKITDNNNYKYFSEINSLKNNHRYKNENKLIKNLELTKKYQEKEILLLKEKVLNLCNIIEDNKIIKANEIKKKDKLILYLQKEKIKNENIIKKLKTRLNKEKSYFKDNININSNKEINKNYTKINKLNNSKDNNEHLETENYLDNKNNNNNTESIKNIIYQKKNYNNSDNIKKRKLRKSIPIKINIDLTHSLKNPVIQNNNDIYETINKNKYSNINKNILKNIKINENIYFNSISRNKSDDFNQKTNIKINDNTIKKNVNLDNIVYIPKKYIISNNNGRSKSITNTNINNLDLKINNKSKEKNKNNEIKNDIINKETLSLERTNYLIESLNKNEDISMSLNLSPIIKNYSKNIIQTIEDNSMYDLFKNNNINNINIYNDNNKNYNHTLKQNFIYKNKLKFNIIDIGYKNNNNNKISSLSPTIRKNSEIIYNKQKNYYYARDHFNKWNISFIISEVKIEILINKDSLLSEAITTIINSIKGNESLYNKLNFIFENKEKINFLSDNIVLDKNKTLEENKLNNHSKIFVVLK